MLLAVESLAIVGVFHICFTARGFAVLDELAPTATFVVFPFALIGVAVCPGVCSVTVLFAVVPLSFIFFAAPEIACFSFCSEDSESGNSFPVISLYAFLIKSEFTENVPSFG